MLFSRPDDLAHEGKVATLAPLDLISAHPWARAVFTTYALSLSFFEVVLLDALVRGGSREAVILSDVYGVRAALSEQGARRAGKDYTVEPIAVDHGIFHPKISALTADGNAHLLVGSGNLTFGGWGMNLEVVEHLHPSFAADAFDDAAGFFELMHAAPHLHHAASSHCAAVAGDLRAAARTGTRSGNIRLFHSLDGAIAERLAQTVADLGGAERLVIAAPFFDGGPAVDNLCTLLRVSEAFVHAHAGGTVKGDVGSNWPALAKVEVRAIRLEALEETKPRKLHAKVLEVTCKRGRVLLSGSANATLAALQRGRNVEACIARIQREPAVGWRYSASEPPELQVASEDENEDREEDTGVLRAVLEGDRISGQILTPEMSGPASIFQVTTEGLESLGPINVDENGMFQVHAPALEVESWKSGRLVIRVEDAVGRRSEGFVSIAAFAAIMRRAGAVFTRMLALLSATETPADVAAIMSWFQEDPRRLADMQPPVTGSGASSGRAAGTGPVISASELTMAHAVGIDGRTALDQTGIAAWRRFMDSIFASLRERRGPFGRTAGRSGDDEEDESKEGQTPAPEDPYIERSLRVFEKLLAVMLSPEHAGRSAMVAFDLTKYVVERLQPAAETARIWFERVVDAVIRAGTPEGRRSDVAAVILAMMRGEPGHADDRAARARLLRLGADLSGGPPPDDSIQGLQEALPQSASFAELWDRVRAVRTFPEQAKTYLRALEAGQPSAGYEDFAREAPDEWPTLEAAIGSNAARDRILVLKRWSEACPRCHMRLPTGQEQSLRAHSVATAKSCCDRIIIWPGD